jgi:hypothetical protein
MRSIASASSKPPTSGNAKEFFRAKQKPLARREGSFET